MPRIRVIHWKHTESEPLLKAVQAAGFTGEYLPEANGAAIARAIRQSPPDAVVVDLSRLPSHGREMGVWLRNNKTLRAIPLIYVSGDPRKVAEVKAVLPDAAYTTQDQLASVLKTACGAQVSNPVIPPSAMERFKNKSAAQKLGIRKSSTVAVIDPPRDYVSVLGDLPPDVEIHEGSTAVQDVTLWFIRDSESMLDALPRMRAIASKTKLWIVWPKGKSNRFREAPIREMGIEGGLVDYKICSVNEQWSGILFARSKT